MKMHKTKLLLLSTLILIISVSAFSQEKEKITPSILLQYFKNTEGLSSLKAILTWPKDGVDIPLPGMEVSFYIASGEKKLLKTAVTDNKGIARIPLDDILKLPVNNMGLWQFSSEFNGMDTIEITSAEVSVKDAILEMKLTVTDSIKKVSVKATTIKNGQKVPVAGETVIIGVPRMFSLLQIASTSLDKNGTISVEVPGDIPGDKEGNLTIIARFEDNPIYGNVERREVIKWGIPTSYAPTNTHRALWTKTPPMWMIITLSILLIGVWGHYLFAIISLILIRIDAKRKKAKDEYKL